MRPLRSVPVAVGLVAAGVLLAASPARAGDLIIDTKGGAVSATRPSGPTPSEADFANSKVVVEEENLDKIVFSLVVPGLAPQRQTVDTSTVREIFHDPANVPPDLTQGRQLLDRGRTDEARDAFQKVLRDGNAATWAKQEAAFRLADSYWVEGAPKEAVDELAKFKQQFGNSRYVPDAIEHRARSLLELDRAADAKAEFQSLLALKGLSEDRKIAAEYGQVWIDERLASQQNDTKALADVVKAYDALASKLQGRAGLEQTTRRALVGKASALIALGKPADAQPVLQKVLDETPATDAVTLAGAYTKLGDAVNLMNAQAHDKAAYKEALKHFLHVVVLYGDTPGAEDYLAESMFRAGEMFRNLASNKADEKDQARDYVQRARREWTEVKERFPGSRWGREAQVALTSR